MSGECSRTTPGRARSRPLRLIAVAVLVVLDVIQDGYQLRPPVLVPLLLAASGLLWVYLQWIWP